MLKPKSQSIALVIFFIWAAIYSSNSLASTGTRGGGDLVDMIPMAEDVKSKAQIISTKLRSELIRFVESQRSRGRLKNIIRELEPKGLMDDLKFSPYQILNKNYCVADNSSAKDASTLMGVPRAPICFSAYRLAQERAALYQLVALAFHEHVHHFGYEDKDNSILQVALLEANKFFRPWMPPP